MKLKGLHYLTLLFVLVLFSYGTADAQIVDAVKDAAGKTKDVTVDAAKKTADVTKKAAEGTKDVTVKGAEKTGDVLSDGYDKAEDVGSDVVEGTKDTYDKAGDLASDAADKTEETVDNRDNIATDILKATANGTKKVVYYSGDKAADLAKLGYKGGKFVVVKTWDGTKYVARKLQIYEKEKRP